MSGDGGLREDVGKVGAFCEPEADIGLEAGHLAKGELVDRTWSVEVVVVVGLSGGVGIAGLRSIDGGGDDVEV